MTSLEGPIHFSLHALARFEERVRPGLPFESVKLEVERIASVANREEGAPPWYRGERIESNVGYLIAADICFPLARTGAGLVAVTCATRGTLAEGTRRRRNRSRSNRTEGRRAGKIADRLTPRTPIRRENPYDDAA